MSQPEGPPRRHWTAGAIAVLVIGLLFLLPSGLCTAVMGVLSIASLVADPRQSSDALSTFLESLTFAAPFIAIGAGLVWLARRLRRTR